MHVTVADSATPLLVLPVIDVVLRPVTGSLKMTVRLTCWAPPAGVRIAAVGVAQSFAGAGATVLKVQLVEGRRFPAVLETAPLATTVDVVPATRCADGTNVANRRVAS
jgi:hypothetical protein